MKITRKKTRKQRRAENRRRFQQAKLKKSKRTRRSFSYRGHILAPDGTGGFQVRTSPKEDRKRRLEREASNRDFEKQRKARISELIREGYSPLAIRKMTVDSIPQRYVSKNGRVSNDWEP
jgi:hypothetical protein